jgi:two-component system sensor histidine kinase QseC
MQARSLQTRLLVMTLGLVVTIWAGVASVTWVSARHELDELLDGHLAQTAALLVVQQLEAQAGDVVDAPSLHKYAPRVAFQVFHRGSLVMRTTNVGTMPMTGKGPGFATELVNDGQEWRIFSTHGAGQDVRVYVGEQTASRREILWAVILSMLLPMMVALPLLALMLWWAVRQGLDPLRQLGTLLGQRQPQALEPVALHDMPPEMRPMVNALNGLLARIESMVMTERRFTADAAHELRTPIAAIRAQAQVALGAGADVAQRDHALQYTLAGCERATRLVEQLLTLARLETASAALSASVAPVNLGMVTRGVAAELAPTAMARHQSLELEADTPVLVAGDDVLIGVMVRNLIDNAMRYSPDGARVLVIVKSEAGQPLVRVEDGGPGMTEQEMARLGERFYRVTGIKQTGSGLGWSIVKRLSDAFGATTQVARSSALGGLAVEVRWPAR